MNGISAQGSKIEIGSGTGSAKNIIGVAVGNPTILTLTAHALLAGTMVTLAGLTGTDAALLNGQSLPITNLTTNTVAVNIDTTGKNITATGTATPTTYVKLLGAQQFTPPETSSAELDQTDLDSTAKEFILGLIDNGSFGIDMKYIKDDPGQDGFAAANGDGLQRPFKVTLPNSVVFAFNGLVKGYNKIPIAGVDKILTRKTTIRITGAVTQA